LKSCHDLNLVQKLLQTVQKLAQSQSITNITNNITHNNNTSTDNSTNNTQHVHVNSFGEENTDYIDNTVLDRFALNKHSGLAKLLNHKHYHPDHPENNNLRIPNMKHPYIQTKSDRGWETRPRNKVLDEMINDGKNMMDEHITDNESRLIRNKSRVLVESAQRFIYDLTMVLNKETLDQHDKTIIKNLRTEVYGMIVSSTRQEEDIP
jgi:hypothetical protein